MRLIIIVNLNLIILLILWELAPMILGNLKFLQGLSKNIIDNQLLRKKNLKIKLKVVWLSNLLILMNKFLR